MIYQRDTRFNSFELIAPNAAPGWILDKHEPIDTWFLTIEGIVVDGNERNGELNEYWNRR
jgi:hypothetical protein